MGSGAERGSAGATRVVLACSGLDHVHRGFESFARECFDALRTEPELEITLVKGSGAVGPGECSIRTLTRDARSARALARAWGREPFRVEQVAFGASLLPLLARRRPDVVYLSEWHTGLVLGAARRASGAGFRLAFCNGASAVGRFAHLDRVQQLTPAALRTVLEHGADPRRHTLLPLGVSIAPGFEPATDAERASLRARLGLPVDRQLVLSVSALNRQKRIDYVIDELARLPHPRPYLILLGHEEPETAALREAARDRLGLGGHTIRMVPRAEVAAFYRASDVFVLASLGESFGRVLVEAMAHGLFCVAHDYEVTSYVLGGHGHLTDLSKPGALANVLRAPRYGDGARAIARHRFAYESFSWDRLTPAYVSFLKSTASGQAAQLAASANSTVSSSSGEAVWMK
jgi:glycosyltransferase involved in cell wall biosynthesis